MIGAARPLYGRVVLITRPAERSEKLQRKLEALGARVEARPTIALELPADLDPARRALGRLGSYDWLLFTSPTGVRFFFLLGQRFLGRDPSIGCPVAAIGPSTARAARAAGITTEVVAATNSAEGLAEALGGHVRTGQRVLLVRPEVAREVLPVALRSAGARVDAVPFYRNVAAPDIGETARDVRREVFDVVVFTSPSTAQRLLDGAAAAGIEIREALRRMKVVAIGEVTARALDQAELTVSAIARKPSDDDIVEAIQELFPSA
jgi:uroporphyrinogen III methyltransferase/synthase